MSLFKVSMGLVALLVMVAQSDAQTIDVEGTWFTPSMKSAVTIEDCGNGTPCGFVSYADPAPDDPLTHDINNPDRQLRGRPVLGMPLMWGFKPRSGRSGWKRGRIYDPTSGRTFGAGIKLTDDGTLEVKGCYGPICRTQIWTRVPADLALADAHTDLSALE